MFLKKFIKNDIFGSCISFNFFLFDPGKLIFNESLGIGAKFDFGEEADLLARILDEKKFLANSINFNIETSYKNQANP